MAVLVGITSQEKAESVFDSHKKQISDYRSKKFTDTLMEAFKHTVWFLSAYAFSLVRFSLIVEQLARNFARNYQRPLSLFLGLRWYFRNHFRFQTAERSLWLKFSFVYKKFVCICYSLNVSFCFSSFFELKLIYFYLKVFIVFFAHCNSA